MQSSSIVEAYIPKATKISFFCSSRNIAVLSGFHHSSTHTWIDITIHATISFCERNPIFMFFVSHHTTFYTSHNKKVIKSKIKCYLPYGSAVCALIVSLLCISCPYLSRPFARLLLLERRCRFAVLSNRYLPVPVILMRFFAPECVLSFMIKINNDYFLGYKMILKVFQCLATRDFSSFL